MEKKPAKTETVSAKVTREVKKKLEAKARRQERKLSFVIAKILEAAAG